MSESLRSLWRKTRAGRRLIGVLRVLARHGFADALQRVGVDRLLRGAPGDGEAPEETLATLTRPQRLVKALEELGPTYVKFGQLLSTRPDLLPEAYVLELARLRDRVTPFPAQQAKAALEAELGRRTEEIFTTFSEQPVASGSIAQVHEATLKETGERVVVKILRPDLRRRIEDDLVLLREMALILESFHEFNLFRPTELVEEFDRMLHRELDFVAEAANTARFAELFQNDAVIRAPAVYWPYTARGVITLRQMLGTPLLEAARTGQVDRGWAARELGRAFMVQFFEHGFFHADPHPGNILAGKDGTIALVDFGSTGHLAEHLRALLGTVLLALERGDLELIADVLLDVSRFAAPVSRPEIVTTLMEMTDRHFGVPVEHLDLGEIFRELLRAAHRHRLSLPREFVLLGRSLVLVGSIIRELDPSLSVAALARPYGRQLAWEKISPARLLRRSAGGGYHLVTLLEGLPRHLKSLLRQAEAGDLRLSHRLETLPWLVEALDRRTNRLSVAVITAAFFLGASVLVARKAAPTLAHLGALFGADWRGALGDFSLLGGLGLLAACLLGGWLVLGVLRSGRLSK